jgi:hypothetical protein
VRVQQRRLWRHPRQAAGAAEVQEIGGFSGFPARKGRPVTAQGEALGLACGGGTRPERAEQIKRGQSEPVPPLHSWRRADRRRFLLSLSITFQRYTFVFIAQVGNVPIREEGFPFCCIVTT